MGTATLLLRAVLSSSVFYALQSKPMGEMRQDDHALFGQAKHGSPIKMSQLGPLRDLLGTWQGNLGMVATFLPLSAQGVNSQQNEHFNYTETIVFEPILGKVMNRGVQGAQQWNATEESDQIIYGITYAQTVISIPDSPMLKRSILHAERGQWIFNAQQSVPEKWQVARSGTLPHGMTLVATGNYSNQTGAEVKAHQYSLRVSQPSYYNTTATNAGNFDFGFYNQVNPWAPPYGPGNQNLQHQGYNLSPLLKLEAHLGDDLENMSATMLSVSSSFQGGSLGTLPNIYAQLMPNSFNATMWVQKWRDGAGKVVRQQLQYVQTVFFNFEAKFVPECRQQSGEPMQTNKLECRIRWPHSMSNTLKKVADWTCPIGLDDFCKEMQDVQTQGNGGSIVI